MNITSQFFLTYYAGSSNLNLMSIPSNINNDPYKRAEYNRFINNISTIYASQNNSGLIPVFWTKVSGSQYIPDDNSTLTELKPKESYYFITRNETALPIKIPYTESLLPGFTDYNFIPTVSFSGEKLLTNGNYAYLSFPIQGLQPYEDYRFKFNSIYANWPCTINPISGIFKPSDTEYTVSAVLEFCNTSNNHINDSNLLPYTLNAHKIDYNNLYNIFNIEINPMSYISDSITGDSINIQCKNCLQKDTDSLSSVISDTAPSVILPQTIDLITYDKAQVKRDKLQTRIDNFNLKIDSLNPIDDQYLVLLNTYSNIITKLNNEINETRDGRFCTFKSKISNLDRNYSYSFQYRSVDGNWPAVVITPASGLISKENNYEIVTTVAFAACSGAYGENTPGYLDYHNTSKFDKNNVYTMIELVVSRTDNNPNYSTTSKPLPIFCKDCLNQ